MALLDTQFYAASDTSDLSDIALAYAQRGYRIFPVRRDKQPYVKWQKEATNGLAQVQRQWSNIPDANIGLALPDGIIVFDVDTRHGGSLDNLGTLPETVIARTGGGGWHVFFTLPEGVTPAQSSPLPGIDTRIGGKGYVVVPPSVHDSGNTYQWVDGCSLLDRDPAPIPPHLLKLVTQSPKTPHRTTTTPQLYAVPSPASDWLRRAIAKVQDGEHRNDTGLWLACQLRDNGHTQEDAESIMLRYQEDVEDEGDHPYTEAEALATVLSAYSTAPRDPATPAQGAQQPIGWVCAADIQPRDIEWLWHGRIPLGMITGVIGDGAVGKSLLTTMLAAHVSRGWALPGEAQGVQGGVLILNAEDTAAHVIRPRLETAGADLSQIYLPTEWSADALDHLETMVEECKVKLIIIDPIMSFLGNKDGHKEQDVRRLLAPLTRLAEDTGTAIVAIRHLPKNESTRTQYRGSGSIAFTNVSRAELLLAKDPNDESQRILTVNKGNLSKPVASLAFTIDDQGGIPRLRYMGESTYTATELLHTEAPASATRQDIRRALETLDASGTLTPKEIAESTGLHDGLVRLTLRRMVDAGEITQPARGQYRLA